MAQILWKTVWNFLIRVKKKFRMVQHAFMDIYPWEMKIYVQPDIYTNVHRSFIQSSQKLGETYRCHSMSEWINKLLYSHAVNILLNNKKEQTIDTQLLV